nr:chemotaxis protein CheW [Bacteriovorax sp. HI3]
MNKTEEASGRDAFASMEDNGLRHLVFSIKNEEYALPLLSVKEVIGMTGTTPIPQSPAYFKGVINLRGQIIPIIDLRVKLGLLTHADGPETSIIILDYGTSCVGLVVDSINCVLVFSSNEVVAATFSDNALKHSCIREVAKKGDRLILSLDVELMLNISDRQILSQKNLKQVA